MRDILYIVVHCTASPQTKTIAEIREEWREDLGWKSPGYHIIVTPVGSYIRLADDDAICNGVAGFNKNALHISYIGGINAQGKPVDNRTEKQKDRLRQLIGFWKKRYPKAKILGHRDLSPDKDGNGVIDRFERIKECPCFDAIPEYQDIT